MKISYAEAQQAAHPLDYEKARLIVDAATCLKLALEDANVSVAELAAQLGRGKAIVYRQIAGEENLTLGKLAELAFHLGKRFQIDLCDIEEAKVNACSQTLRLMWEHQRRPVLRVIESPQGSDMPTKHQTAA